MKRVKYKALKWFIQVPQLSKNRTRNSGAELGWSLRESRDTQEDCRVLLGSSCIRGCTSVTAHTTWSGFPGGSDGKASAHNAGDPGSIPRLRRSPRRKWQPTPVRLPRKFHRWRSLVGYSPWGRKESDMTERLQFLSFFLSIFLSPAWSGLPSRGTQKAGWGGKKVKHRIRLKFGVYEDGDWRITSLLGRGGHGKSAVSDSLWGSGLMWTRLTPWGAVIRLERLMGLKRR